MINWIIHTFSIYSTVKNGDGYSEDVIELENFKGSIQETEDKKIIGFWGVWRFTVIVEGSLEIKENDEIRDLDNWDTSYTVTRIERTQRRYAPQRILLYVDLYANS